MVTRKPGSPHFEAMPTRWAVGGGVALAWLSRYRRLSKDYEECTEASLQSAHIAVVFRNWHGNCLVALTNGVD